MSKIKVGLHLSVNDDAQIVCSACSEDTSIDWSASFNRADSLRLAQRIARLRPDSAEATGAIEARFLRAWRTSGMSLGKLMIGAANAYALGSAVSIPGLADEALVSMVEKYAAESKAKAAL